MSWSNSGGTAAGFEEAFTSAGSGLRGRSVNLDFARLFSASEQEEQQAGSALYLFWNHICVCLSSIPSRSLIAFR